MVETPRRGRAVKFYFFALKGQVILAQGAALGKGATARFALKERLLRRSFRA